jgi:hypothetical protein
MIMSQTIPALRLPGEASLRVTPTSAPGATLLAAVQHEPHRQRACVPQSQRATVAGWASLHAHRQGTLLALAQGAPLGRPEI